MFVKKLIARQRRKSTETLSALKTIQEMQKMQNIWEIKVTKLQSNKKQQKTCINIHIKMIQK